MSGGAKSRTNSKPSIKYRYNPHGGAFFDLVDVAPDNYAPCSRDKIKDPDQKTEAKSLDLLSTADLISGVGRLWDYASSSLPVLHHKTSKQNDEDLRKENMFYYPTEDGNIIASVSSNSPHASVDLKTSSPDSPRVKVRTHLDPLQVTRKPSSFVCYSKSHIYPGCLWRHLCYSSDKMFLPCKENGVSGLIIPYELQNVYRWMDDIRLSRIRHKMNPTGANNDTLTRSNVCHNDLVETLDSSSGEDANGTMKTSADITSLSSDYLLHPIQDAETDSSVSMVPTSSLQADSDTKHLCSDTSSYLESDHGKEEKFDMEISSSTQYKPKYGLAKQEHAFAGAFAGIFVSLCLHPVDTVKTVVQSCHNGERSIPNIGKSIISERGLSGLYRGIASNIASSAPISAVYTFTYESVKGALLPLLAKEYHSVAHCVGGGCASVATSFIFTPSERIKQQMQVGSHYNSCWNALLSIVGKGGFSSLYTGWGAVLCRNVPHSIIKFYTYESLKHLMFSFQSNAQPTTTTTLLCGGLAGSTAALFTTPFDVVKTRLQTQIPGSVNRYDGVLDTLKEIAKHEGLTGLYRGLTPRLVMYMTQGALFFASYESFKRLFCLEACRI